MADAEAVRTWARANGHDVAERGKLPASVTRAYDDAHPAADETTGVTEADFWVGGDLPPDPFTAEPPPAETAEPPKERPPRAVKGRTRTATKAKRGWRGILPQMPKTPRGGKRTDLGEFAADTWRELAMMTSALAPPVSRVLDIQAPYAGLVADDAIRNIPVLDAIVQPVAKYATSIRALDGLIGPPLYTLMICFDPAPWAVTEQGKMIVTEDGRPVPTPRTAMTLMGMRMSLVHMLRVTGRRAEELAQQAAEDIAMSQEIDKLIDVILFGRPPGPAAPPQPPQRAEEPIQPTSVFRYPPSPVGPDGRPVNVMDGTGTDPARGM